jgi:glutathione synthase/RimK-type ligase-like ATP-grasp enzyme
MREAAQLKILVFATQPDPLAARISLALADVGFGVAALTRSGHPIRVVRKVKHHFAYHSQSSSRSILAAIDRWAPDLVVCSDDLAVRELQALHMEMATSADPATKHISDLIELSLGPPASFPATGNKSVFLTLAERLGLRCPRTTVLQAAQAFNLDPTELTYPIVVKADHSDGGRCVRTVKSRSDLRNTVWELQTPCSWRARPLFGAILGSKAMSLLTFPLRRTISLQDYIVGRPANRAVLCWKGKVLAGISVEAVEVTHDRGPASVVRLIDHPEMAEAADHVVRHLNLSGFVGFDFIVDAANQAWLLEMNPRVTPICHLALADGTNLAGSLYKQMTSQLPRSRDVPIRHDVIALFPNEVIRSPSSDYLTSCQHDVPWEEPELVRNILNRELRTRWLKRARAFVESRCPSIAGALARIGLIDARAPTGVTPPL